MHPVALSTVPGPASVVAAPVVADTERYDADSQTRAELNDGYAAVFIVVVQIIAVDPAAVAFRVHIAPSPIVETTIHGQKTVGRNGEDQRIVGARSGAEVHVTLGICGAPSGRAQSECYKGEERQ